MIEALIVAKTMRTRKMRGSRRWEVTAGCARGFRCHTLVELAEFWKTWSEFDGPIEAGKEGGGVSARPGSRPSGSLGWSGVVDEAGRKELIHDMNGFSISILDKRIGKREGEQYSDSTSPDSEVEEENRPTGDADDTSGALLRWTRCRRPHLKDKCVFPHSIDECMVGSKESCVNLCLFSIVDWSLPRTATASTLTSTCSSWS